MSILDHPPELPLAIFSHAVSISPALEHEDYLERTRTLLSFSPVHRQWTSIAQEVLLSEVWIGSTNSRDGDIERKGLQLVQARVNGTKYLTVEGDIEALLRVTGAERWQNLVHLENRPQYSETDSTRLDTFNRSPNLETLNLCYSNFSFKESDFCLPFPKLSPAQMQNLTHLALESPAYFRSDPAQLFGLMLPHINTLALSEPSTESSNTALFRLLGHCSKLKHLSLYRENRDLESLLSKDAAGLELESLHMSSSAIDDSTALLPRLIALAKGESETIKARGCLIRRSRGSVS